MSTEELRINPEALRDWLIDSRITASFAPTPILERLLKLSWPDKTDLRFIITGEDRLTQYPSNDIPFAVINQYGPSENTVVTTDYYVPVGVTTGTPSIGRPIANTEVYVLDSHLQLVPIGVIGDLSILEGRVLHVDMLIVRILQRKIYSTSFQVRRTSLLYRRQSKLSF